MRVAVHKNRRAVQPHAGAVQRMRRPVHRIPAPVHKGGVAGPLSANPYSRATRPCSGDGVPFSRCAQPSRCTPKQGLGRGELYAKSRYPCTKVAAPCVASRLWYRLVPFSYQNHPSRARRSTRRASHPASGTRTFRSGSRTPPNRASTSPRSAHAPRDRSRQRQARPGGPTIRSSRQDAGMPTPVVDSTAPSM